MKFITSFYDLIKGYKNQAFKLIHSYDKYEKKFLDGVTLLSNVICKGGVPP